MKNYEGKLHRNSDIVMRQIGGETILIPIHQTGADLQKVYLLNETAAIVWMILDVPTTFTEILDTLARDFEAEKSLIDHDLSELIQELIANNFVSVGHV